MGCTNSKLDDLPAVSLCRNRCNFLSEAIRHRYDLSNAHGEYRQSLSAIGEAIQKFFIYNDASASNIHTHKPAAGAPIAVGRQSHSHSHSGSHLHFHSDSDSDFEDEDVSPSDSPFHHHHDSGNSSPVHTYRRDMSNDVGDETLGSYPVGGYMNMNYNMNMENNMHMDNNMRMGNNMHMNYMKKEARPSVLYKERPISTETVEVGMNYMKNEATPSVLYEERPYSTEAIRMEMNYMRNEATPSVLYEQRVRMDKGESSSSSSYYPYSNDYTSGNPNYNSYYGGGMDNGYGNGFSGYGGGGVGYMVPMGNLEASSSKPPPPPPSPPRGSGWDFLNPFESFASYYPPHTLSSRDSKEVREEEGIPDLEDEHEVVKEVYRDNNNKFLQSEGKSYSKELKEDHVSKVIEPDREMYDSRASVENEPVEYEVHVVDKKVVGGGERSGDGGGVAAFKVSADSDVVREIQVQFDRASESGSEVAKILEVGKFPYKKSAAYQVSSKVLQVITPSLPHHSNAESSAIDKSNPLYLDSDLVSGMRSASLSSTLQKLYLWEKKLYEEVKVEEKMRVLHERKCRKLKRLDERGAEAQKIDTTRTLVRSLSAKIRMAIQVVDKISVTINRLRDEELWPQLNEVVQGLTRMWKSMYECHRIQSQAIAQAKRLDAAAMHTHFTDDQLESTMQLEHELLSWTLNFSCWVGAQKGFVQSLNNWLMKCLLYVPEETPDGIVPFSPGRLGAPPVFVICNQWAQAMDRISEKEVIDSMREFATFILQLWERDSLEMRQRMMANKDMERKVKNLERKDQKIHKEIQALDKKIVLSSGAVNGLPSHVVYQSETSKKGSLQSSLQHIFEAMERFAANSAKAYDELLQRIEEDRQDRLSRENQRES